MDRGMTADQFLSAIWRRKALVGAIAGAVFIIGAAIVFSIPSVFTATAVVRVEPQRPTTELLQRTVSEQVEDRLLTVRQELMARPILLRTIGELNLYPEIVSKLGPEAAADAMRRDLAVKVEGQGGSVFEISYSARQREVAAQVANRLPEIYAEETIKIRQAQAARATELFADEINVLRKSLSEWEGKIAQFKVEHQGELPELMESNMRALERITTALRTKSEELRLAEERRGQMATAHHAADSEAGRLQAAEIAIQQALSSAKSEWTDDHPEVQRLTKDLKEMRARRTEAEGRLVSEKDEKARVGSSIASIQREIKDLQEQAESFQKRLDRTPKWAHEMSVMQNDYEVTKAKYQSLLSRRVEAELAQDLEARGSKTLFNIISPAGVPTMPSKPDRIMGLLISLVAGLGFGILAAITLELRDDSLRDGAELRARLPIPVLAVVPYMNGKTEKRLLMPASKNAVVQDALN
jgi:polysaccharide chain length determinant protein (PEP-CTERM system associated)